MKYDLHVLQQSLSIVIRAVQVTIICHPFYSNHDSGRCHSYNLRQNHEVHKYHCVIEPRDGRVKLIVVEYTHH
jgi:hypothetical protein